jgi:hypothetical protein
MPGPSTSTRGSPLLEGLMNRLASVAQFRRPHDLPARIIEHREPCDFAPRINFEPQRLWMWLGDRMIEKNEHKRKAPIHCRLSRREQFASASRMDRIMWPFILIDHEDV